MFSIKYAKETDEILWFSLDHHISKNEFLIKVSENRCYIIFDDQKPIGVMRYNLFWDNIPFLNLIYLIDDYRKVGFGTKAMKHWETEMCSLGYNAVMTSTQADEEAQHFYRKLNYKDAGCLVLDTQPIEIFLIKSL